MTGDERESAREFSRVLLMIGPAQPAGLNPHQPVVVTDHGDVELPVSMVAYDDALGRCR